MKNCLYLGDVNDEDVLNWLCEHISPLVLTTKAEYDYFEMYHGDDDKWIMHSADVSDVSSSKWDTVTEIIFKNKEDVMYCHLVWGGSIQ
jgi:hypothetical protein